MTKDEGERKIRNAFGRIRASITIGRMPQSSINRLQEMIEEEMKIAITAFRDACKCGDPGPPRESGTVEIEPDP